MNSNKIIKVNKQSKKLTEKPQPVPPADQEIEINVEDIELEIEEPDQLMQLESLGEIYPDESVYGSGWSVTELLNEFSGR